MNRPTVCIYHYERLVVTFFSSVANPKIIDPRFVLALSQKKKKMQHDKLMCVCL